MEYCNISWKILSKQEANFKIPVSAGSNSFIGQGLSLANKGRLEWGLGFIPVNLNKAESRDRLS